MDDDRCYMPLPTEEERAEWALQAPQRHANTKQYSILPTTAKRRTGHDRPLDGNFLK